MKNRIWMVLVMISLFAISCEKEGEIIWSSEVDIQYFSARGFNLRFVEIRKFEENIMSNHTNYTVLRDITLNIADLLVVDNTDVITIGNQKVTSAAVWNEDKTDLVMDPNRYPQLDAFNQIMVNCERIPLTFNFDARTSRDDNIANIYRGSCVFATEHTFTGPRIQGVPNTGMFIRYKLLGAEFEMRDGLLIIKLPAQYTLGIWEGERTVPLSAQEVQRIIDNGVEGVDYHLFNRDGMTLVRIDNHLYQRRFSSWVYHSIADPHHTTAYIRNQSWIVFEVLDWDEIVKSYPYLQHNNGARVYVEPQNHKNRGSYNNDAARSWRFGDPRDWETITTPTPWCTK